jgi:hypothetical protein
MRHLMLMWTDADATSGDESDFQAWAEFDVQVNDEAVERRPFAEGKRQIQAFYIMDLPSMDAALEADQIVPYATSAPRAVELVQDGTLKKYPGFPHGMPTTHADTTNAGQPRKPRGKPVPGPAKTYLSRQR